MLGWEFRGIRGLWEGVWWVRSVTRSMEIWRESEWRDLCLATQLGLSTEREGGHILEHIEPDAQ